MEDRSWEIEDGINSDKTTLWMDYGSAFNRRNSAAALAASTSLGASTATHFSKYVAAAALSPRISRLLPA